MCWAVLDYDMQQVFNPAAKGWMKDLLYGDDPNSNFFIALLTKLTPKVCCHWPLMMMQYLSSSSRCSIGCCATSIPTSLSIPNCLETSSKTMVVNNTNAP